MGDFNGAGWLEKMMTEQESTSFGAMLRHWRLVSGLTQEVLAERSGLGIRSIQGLERGETQPRSETLRRLRELCSSRPSKSTHLSGWGNRGPVSGTQVRRLLMLSAVRADRGQHCATICRSN